MVIAIIITSCILLSACASSPSCWSVDHIESSQKEFAGARLRYRSETGVDLEWIKSHEETHLYLTLSNFRIPPYQDRSDQAQIAINEETFIVARHRGGQKLFLSEEAIERIFSLLQEGSPFIIELAGYTTLVDPTQFAANFEKFNKSPLFKNLIRVPL